MKRKHERATAPNSIRVELARWPFGLSLAGGLLLWLAFPPIGWNWLAWLAPVPWLLLVTPPTLPGRRPYLRMWLGSAAFWLAMLQGIRLAHPANHLGWLALSLYLAAYLPLFVAITRRAVHAARAPLVIVAPVVWSGLELLRGYFLTGFTMGMLGHSQFEHPLLLQVADFTGEIGIGFLVMIGATGVVHARCSHRLWPAVTALAVLSASAGYGAWRLNQPLAESPRRPLKVALLQGTADKFFDGDTARIQRSFDQYWNLMKQVRDEHPDLDLIVWPEAAFTGMQPEFLGDAPTTRPSGATLTITEMQDRWEQLRGAFAQKSRLAAETANRVWRNGDFQRLDIHLLVGVETMEHRGGHMLQRNTALHIAPDSEIAARYFKMHPVAFGEFIPFGDRWPWLYSLTPMSMGLTPGESAEPVIVKDHFIAPSICFESTVARLIRRQIRDIERRTSVSPDILVSVSDDGWFWGSSILDLQLACATIRAVELRRPFLIAANTGITASIDGCGRILARCPRRQEQALIVSVRPDGRVSSYLLLGDWFGWCCCLFALHWSGAIDWCVRRAGCSWSKP